MDNFKSPLDSLPILHARKDPTIAAIVGFLGGGIGLGIYFRSWIDLTLPILVVICIVILVPQFGALGAAALVGVYGFFRATNSNARRTEE